MYLCTICIRGYALNHTKLILSRGMIYSILKRYYEDVCACLNFLEEGF